MNNEYQLLPLLTLYIDEIRDGKHLQPNGKKIKKGSAQNYIYLQKLLYDFSLKKNFELRIRSCSVEDKITFEEEKKYWKMFFKTFTNYLYDDLGHFDNYVGSTIKLLKAFFNYLKTEKGFEVGEFYKKFFCSSEEVEIIVLSPDRLNFLINSTELHSRLNPVLTRVKDVFVFGCTVGLRYSDLMNLRLENLELTEGKTYLKVQSQKTQTFTRVKLPNYALQIIEKYKAGDSKQLLPYFNKVFLNKKIKQLMEIAGFTEPAIKTRQRRGIPVTVNRLQKQKNYRFCDLITTHTMRRTAITTMLSFGMNEQVVRRISGHAAGSKEFYRYVSFAQTYMDKEIDLVHQKLSRN